MIHIYYEYLLETYYHKNFYGDYDPLNFFKVININIRNKY